MATKNILCDCNYTMGGRLHDFWWVPARGCFTSAYFWRITWNKRQALYYVAHCSSKKVTYDYNDHFSCHCCSCRATDILKTLGLEEAVPEDQLGKESGTNIPRVRSANEHTTKCYVLLQRRRQRRQSSGSWTLYLRGQIQFLWRVL